MARHKCRRSSVAIRHTIGIFVLGVVLLFLAQLFVSFLRAGDWRGALFVLLAGVGLTAISLYPAKRR